MFLNSRKLVGKYVSGLIPEKIPDFLFMQLKLRSGDRSYYDIRAEA